MRLDAQNVRVAHYQAAMHQYLKTLRERDYVVQRYGKDSLYEPDFSENLFLWLSPAIFMIFIAVSVLLVRRR